MRLGVVLVGLVGINVYVFFFNRGTAPREILNMQSTSKTFESTRQEALAADVRKARASWSRPHRAPRARAALRPPRPVKRAASPERRSSRRCARPPRKPWEA